MKKYEKPSFEVENFDISDIITESSAIDSMLDKNGHAIEKTIDFGKLSL